MHNFFVESDALDGVFRITGADHNHIKNVLRMREGNTFLVSYDGKSHLCALAGFENDTALAEIVEEDYQDTELPVQLYLFQGLPKGDKLELIIQKAVELGASGIIPVEMSRSVVKIEDKKRKQKQERWQAIAESAAKQSKRNVIPTVSEAVSYKKAMELASEMDVFLVPYENERGMAATADALEKLKNAKKVGVLIGPEGGFDDKEIALAKDAGGEIVSLGKRILRAETAAITALSMCMLYIEMNV
ncbi:MAG: 16S rRNA (uracil(1498)-N(3))-methyltransferase [Ruminococcaceae bacterium]|nr:16S rRNA (uracil(1498)-N(3))-methyltransferase [Oscillospiraceae bacterium]